MSFVLDTNNKEFYLTLDYINCTNCSIFLTGKAGTGKTTLVKYLRETTFKNYVVVATTGVAAINAKGVTVHSLFALPFIPYVKNPLPQHLDGTVCSEKSLIAGLRFNKQKINLLRNLDLLIIDEVSMLRCDILDAIDTVLKYIRHNKQSFGGVQILFVGDMHQLPPVLVQREEQILKEYYSSFYFFNAEVINDLQLLHIELKKIYRQTDQVFINALNKIRHNNPDKAIFDFLNKRYISNFIPDDKDYYITLSSHNKSADNINDKKLRELKTPAFFYQAEVRDNFTESKYPCSKNLQLKEGTQVMFIKNDINKKYFNGKIARVVKLTQDDIWVKFDDSLEDFKLNLETWENIKYELLPNGKMKEAVLGSFTQYPLRLAWAITVHKSQGLTFEKVILDIANAFTFGQVYVALSRCKSYKGLVLSAPLNKSVIFENEKIKDFSEKEMSADELAISLPSKKIEYHHHLFANIFNFKYELKALLNYINQYNLHNTAELNNIKKKLEDLAEVNNKYLSQLHTLTVNAFEQNNNYNEIEKLKIRLQDGQKYYYDQLSKGVLLPFANFVTSVISSSKATKEVKEELENIYGLFFDALRLIYNIRCDGFLVNQNDNKIEHLHYSKISNKTKTSV